MHSIMNSHCPSHHCSEQLHSQDSVARAAAVCAQPLDLRLGKAAWREDETHDEAFIYELILNP